MNCTFTSDSPDSPVCVQSGPVAYENSCSANMACAEGICLNLNATELLCYQFCQTPAHCDNGGDCISLTDSPYKVCSIDDIYDTCNLLAQDCGSGKACHLVSGQNEPVCLPEGSVPVDGDCSGNAAACAVGLVCINNRCKELCDKGESDPCGNFTPCANWYQDAGYCDD